MSSRERGWVVIPFFTRPLIELPGDMVEVYLQSCGSLPTPTLSGNHFWVYDTQDAAKKAKETLEHWEGTCVTQVHMGRCQVSLRELKDWDDLTDEGYFVKFVDSPPVVEEPVEEEVS